MGQAQKSVTATPDQFEAPTENHDDTTKDVPISTTDSIDIALNQVPQEITKRGTSNYPDNFKLLPKDDSPIFGPIMFNVCVRPQIAGFEQYTQQGALGHVAVAAEFPRTKVGFPLLASEFQTVSVMHQIGQRFFDVNENGVETGELYNFANLPGSLQDMVELP
jgi:hypothetical protein